MAEHLHRIGIFGGQNAELRVVLERARQVHQLAVGARYQSLFRQAWRNLLRDLCRGGAARNFAGRTIRQSNLNALHVVIYSPVETSSLLALTNAVKNEDGVAGFAQPAVR